MWGGWGMGSIRNDDADGELCDKSSVVHCVLFWGIVLREK